MSLPIQVVVGDHDLTDKIDSLTFSNVDPGGFEAASISISEDVPVDDKGALFVVRAGSEYVFYGRVAEDGVTSSFGRATTQIGAEGAGAALKDSQYTMIYVDRDFSAWTGASVQHRINLDAANYAAIDPQVVQDTTTKQASLLLEVVGAWVAGAQPHVVARYDAGENNTISEIQGAWKKENMIEADASWHWDAMLNSDDLDTVNDTSGELRAAGPGTVTVRATDTRRFARLALYYSAAPAGADNYHWYLFWTVAAIYGPHGLPPIGSLTATTAPGFYAGDIVDHARRQAKGIARGVIANGDVITQSAYKTPVTSEQVVTDMAGMTGYHWGVWAPPMLGGLPVLDFRPPPTDATCYVRLSDCEIVDFSSRLADLYDTARVTWQDSAGASHIATVTVENRLLAQQGITGRELTVDAGLSTQARAETLGRAALLLSMTSARAAGSVSLPFAVGLIGGGTMPASLLRAGIDRLRILGLPDQLDILDTDTRSSDTFRVRRVETAMEQGVLKTRVEIDSGSSLLEVLQAKLADATSLATGGSSG